MKKILFALMACGLSFFADAQLFTYGPTAGIGYSTFRTGDDVTSGATSYRAGVHARIKLLGLYVQPGLVYQYLDSGDDVPFVSSRLDIPVNFGMKILIFDINTGPVFNLPLSGKISDIDVMDDLNPGAFSWQVGAGVELFSLKLGLRYQGSIGDVIKEDVSSDATRWRNAYVYLEYQF